MIRVARMLAVRPDEARLVGRIAALFATIEAARGVGEIGADTLVLGQLGAGALPYLYVVLGILSLGATLAFGAAVGRLRRRPLFVAIFLVVAVVLVAERVLLVSRAAPILPLMWLTVYIAGALIGTLIWALAGWVFDARQAKRLFPLFASAAILGGAAGMLAAGPIARIAGAEDLVLVQAGLLAIAAILTAEVSRSGRTSRIRTPRLSIVRELRVGADYVRGSSLMRLIAVAYVLFAILLFSVSYPFLSVMRSAFPSEADLATALGLLSAAVTTLSFVVALTLANRVYARFGIAVVVLVLPVVYVAGFGVWLVRFSLATAVAFRFAQQVTQRGLSNAAWSAFYNVVPSERRAQVLAFMDGVPGQIGISLAGLLLLATGTFLDQTATFVMGAVAAVTALAVVLRIRRAYAANLVRTLRDGLAEQLLEGGPGLVTLSHDPGVVATLTTGLSEANPGVRQMSAELLGRLGATGAEDALKAASGDPDPGVRLAATRALDALDRPLDEGHIAELSVDDDPRLRAEAALALERAGDPVRSRSILEALATSSSWSDRIAALSVVARSSATPPAACRAWVDAGLADPVANVRVAAIEAALSRNSGVLDPLPLLVASLDDPSPAVRRAAAHGLGSRGTGGRELSLGVLTSGSDRAQEAALVALEPHGVEAHPDLVVWALGQVDLAVTARRQADHLSGDPDSETLAFLRVVLGQREARIARRLVHVLAILSAPDDAALVERSLRSDDPETRAVAIEALDTMGDRRLARAVVDLLESAPDERPSDTVETLRILADDPDPWVRHLSARVLAERGDTMPDTTGTLDGIERMLLLRRVPLFAGLAPEDLQRIAVGASEHLYPGGEPLVREGDPGDELVVIIDGTVRVLRADGQVIRSYGPGDHIGELAVLRERPRAATVVADPPAVRGLVISGIGLKAILRERPEAAMAMLTTLAERLGTQQPRAMTGRPRDPTAPRGTLPTGTVTFLRTDVEGSMSLARRLGDRWDALNATHLGLIRAAIDANGGVCVRTEGDAVFGSFHEAGAAVGAAVGAQRALAGHDWPLGVEVRVRMGLHTGEAHLAGDDYGGFEVNRVARIAAAGHGGQIVLSDATRVLTVTRLPVGVAFRDLGRHALKDVPDPEHLYQLDVPGLRTDFPPLRTSTPNDGNLPLRLTSFIGRQTDLDEVDRLLDTGRLVTLSGPGGIGKTSLATEVARRRASRHRDGAWFVALDAVDEPAQVATTIAQTLGLFDGPERSAAQGLSRFLADRSVLLVIDNFEQVLEAAPEVSAILRTSPETRILVTSRAPLHIGGEQDYPVRSLGHDDTLLGRPGGGGVDDGTPFRLFLERARSARPGWDPGPDAPVVIEICDLLDGLPLGIELAAARIALLSPTVIRDRLAAHLPLPGTAPRDVPDRQRTLDATIRWSYDLLPPAEQRLLRRLSVFEAGFDLEQARAVAGADSSEDGDPLGSLVALADQSLITPDVRADDDVTGFGSSVRFRLLRTIQAFGLRQLDAEGSEPATRRRHAEAYLELAEAAAPHLPSLEQSPWLDRLALDRADLRAAVRWSVASGEVELALRTVAALWRFWQLGGHLDEGHDLIQAALAMPGAEAATPWRLGAVTAAGGIAYWRAEREEAVLLYQEQVHLAELLGDEVAQADAAFNLLSAQFLADRQAAWASSEDARRRFERLGDARGVARVDWGQATMLLGGGRAAEARPIFESTMDRFEALGDPMYHAMSMGSLAWIEFGLGDFEAARPWAIRSLVELYALRDFASTTITLQEAVVLAVEAGRFEDAAILTGAFEGSCERFGVRPPIPLQRIIDTKRPQERLAEAIAPERLGALFEHGRRMSLDEAVGHVLRMADAMEATTTDRTETADRP